MFSEFPKLFDKNFAVGFFLPAIVLGGGLYAELNAFSFDIPSGTGDFYPDVTLAAICLWLLAIMLVALNRPLVRLFEGYGDYNPFLMLLECRKEEFRNRVAPLFKLYDEIWAARKAGTAEPEQPEGFSKKLENAVGRFPDQEGYVLPTRFGNIMRAFEVYSRVVYGLDSIPAWPRLVMVLPENVRSQIQDSRATLDFSVNLCAVSGLLTLLYVSFAIWFGETPCLAIFPAAVTVCAFAWFLMRQSALQSGSQIKSAIDMHRGLLATQFGLHLPINIAEESKMWGAFSRMTLYRSPGAGGLLDTYRPAPAEAPAHKPRPETRHAANRHATVPPTPPPMVIAEDSSDQPPDEIAEP